LSNLTVTGQAENPANPTNNKNEPTHRKTIGFAIAIIVGIAGLVVAGVGVGGCLGAISTLDQVTSIIMIATGGAGGIAFLIFGIVGTVKNQSQKKAQSDTQKTKEEEKNNNPPQKTRNGNTQNKINEEISKLNDPNNVKNTKTKIEQKMKVPETEKNNEKEFEKQKKKEQPQTVNAPDKNTLDANEKTISFSDNQAKLIDRSFGMVQIVPFKDVCPLAATKGQPHDAILLRGKMVLFERTLGTVLRFSRAENTDHVIVEDTGQNGVYKIREVQTNDLPDNIWVVDTNKKFYITTTTADGQQEKTEVYLIESKIPKGYDTLNKNTLLIQHTSGDLVRGLYKG
jgi:hypothetical protein